MHPDRCTAARFGVMVVARQLAFVPVIEPIYRTMNLLAFSMPAPILVAAVDARFAPVIMGILVTRGVVRCSVRRFRGVAYL